jgi:hypothetical protein
MNQSNSVTHLGKKRLEATLAIAGYAAGGGAAASTPTPGMEFPKQFMLTASDVLMYASIWKIYFEEDLSQKELMDMLTELGLVAIASLGTAYTVARINTAILCEFADWLGPLGWWASAAISGSVAGLSGVAWALYCDRLYDQRHQANSGQANTRTALAQNGNALNFHAHVLG